MTTRFLFLTTIILLMFTAAFSNVKKQTLRASKHDTKFNWCKKTFNPDNVFSTLTDISVNAVDQSIVIDIQSGSGEPYIWRAYINIHVYFYGGTGYWTGTGPFRRFIPEWGYGWVQYTADIDPMETSGEAIWPFQEYGDEIDGQYYLVSWESMHP